MNAALFVGQSAANMRLPPCKTEMRWKPDSIPGSRKSNRFNSLQMVHTHAPLPRGFFGRCTAGRGSNQSKCPCSANDCLQGGTGIIEGSLEVELPTIWTDEKQSREEAERRERLEERRIRRKKMQMREKVGKLRNTVFFQWFVALEGRKVGSLKRRVRSHLARGEMKNCTPLRCEAHFEVKMYKAPFMEDLWWIHGGSMEDLRRIYGGFMDDKWKI